MHYRCLIVDDEVELAETTAEYFRMFEVSTQFVTSAEACFDFFRENTADIVLLDINLGDGSGFDVCKKLREELNMPILFISARQSDDDVLIALSIGGDDYIKKPYSLSVLLAKVKVLLKRIDSASANDGSYLTEAGRTGPRDPASSAPRTGSGSDDAGRPDDSGDTGFPLFLDPATMSAVCGGRQIPLKAKEYALLNALYKRHDTIVKKEELFEEVWGDAFFGDSTLNVHIRKLREKLEKNPNEPTLIRTVWGTGYLLKLCE
ncbi:MAG: response regulator transcription factor [Lachnospiraceae bacterium]|nr:response regulator transcription factor [Lachnospiraceae bacterium]